MEELMEWMEYIEDRRQKAKVRHKLKDILVIVLFATLADADDWVEIELFGKLHLEYLRKYIKLENGVPSHDTIARVIGMLAPEVLEQMQEKWKELLNREEGEKIKKIIAIDGKTMSGSKKSGTKAVHIVSAWCEEEGFCLGQTAAEEKSNEITAIPTLLEKINIKNQVITIDAMGTQREIAEKIRKKKADYVLALKGNQGTLYEAVREYFADADFCQEIKREGNYKMTREKAHSQIELREYYQTEDIGWLRQKKDWKGIKSIGMVHKTIEKNGIITQENRYYISSLGIDIELFSKAVRGHWSIESMHWHLDVTFREDANETADAIAAQNLNIIRKFCLSILKLVDLIKPKLSMRKKRFAIASAPEQLLDIVLNF